MIAFLHTSPLHKDRFEQLVRQHHASIPIKHFVNVEMLQQAQKTGQTDAEVFKLEVLKIRKENPKLIICTCSTFGQECDKYLDVERIDQPMAEFLVGHFTKIALVYTSVSTQKISADLLLKSAAAHHKNIELVRCDCSAQWPWFEQGNFKQYEKGIADQIKNIDTEVDAYFLAQASMSGAIHFLPRLSHKIYTSPAYGIQYFLSRLASSELPK